MPDIIKGQILGLKELGPTGIPIGSKVSKKALGQIGIPVGGTLLSNLQTENISYFASAEYQKKIKDYQEYGTLFNQEFGRYPTAEEVNQLTSKYVTPQDYGQTLSAKQWARENAPQVQELARRWRGREFSEQEMFLLATAGAGSEGLYVELENYRKYEGFRPLFQQYFQREPTPQEITTIAGQFATPQVYAERLGRFEGFKEFYRQYYGRAPSEPEIETLFTQFVTPEAYGRRLGATQEYERTIPDIERLYREEIQEPIPQREQIIRFFEGGEGAGAFEQRLEEARKRREARFAPGVGVGAEIRAGSLAFPTISTKEWWNWLQ